MPSTINTKEVMKEWSLLAAQLAKPKLDEACDVIATLCVEISRLREEVKYQKNRQDAHEQTYKTMLMEIQNTVSRYT